jgi:hypothetical protein
LVKGCDVESKPEEYELSQCEGNKTWMDGPQLLTYDVLEGIV